MRWRIPACRARRASSRFGKTCRNGIGLRGPQGGYLLPGRQQLQLIQVQKVIDPGAGFGHGRV